MSSTFAPSSISIERRIVRDNTWLRRAGVDEFVELMACVPHVLNYEVVSSEAAVGRAMLAEIETGGRNKTGDLNIVILGGRGAQALHRLIGEKARTEELDWLLGRLNVFTQDALAPMRMNNSFSFVRDFERLLGDAFLEKVKSFNSMRTDAEDLESELVRYAEALEATGGIDIFFLGLGPEAKAASHICYMKPGCGATAADLAGVIPISQSIVEHHIKKFKAGGATTSDADEIECRQATHILTLGPAAILSANRIVQSIVDADTAPAKVASFDRFIKTEIADEPQTRAQQLDENPALWIRMNPNVRSLILANVLAVSN